MTGPQRVLCRLACAAIASTLFGSAAGAAGARHAWTVPDTLRIGVIVAPNALNPLLTTAASESFVESLIFDGLVYALPDGTIEPDLAAVVPTTANGGISRDGRTITYHLRHGVRWQDGAPFTSADVAFTQAATMNPNNNVIVRQPYDHVVRLDTPDPSTVVVHLRAPYAPFIVGWNASTILPAHLLRGKHDLNHDPFNAAPVGTGAFRLDQWDRGSRLTLSSNAQYFDGLPGLHRIVISLIPDANAASVALRTHQIDWIFQTEAPTAAQLSNDPDVRVERFDVNEADAIYLNVTRPILSDVRVRRALSLAVDRASLAKKLGFGFITPAVADIPSFMWAFDPSLRAPYDPARARSLLDAAGWKAGADGIRTRNGVRLVLTYLYASSSPLEAAYAVQIAATLNAVGVQLQLKGLAPNILYAPDGPGFTGAFDLAFSPFYWLNDPDNAVVYSCAALAPHGNNWSRWCNPDYEKWSMVALTHVDRTTRRIAYGHIERTILDDVPAIVTGWRSDTQAVSIDVHGLRDHDTESRPYRWSI